MIGEVPKCEGKHNHTDIVAKAKADMPDIDKLYDLSELFKVFGDSTRIRILFLLMKEESMCVCDIAESLDMGISAVSHQLRVLKIANLVKFRRDGKAVFYGLADDHIRSILGQGMEHIEEE